MGHLSLLGQIYPCTISPDIIILQYIPKKYEIYFVFWDYFWIIRTFSILYDNLNKLFWYTLLNAHKFKAGAKELPGFDVYPNPQAGMEICVKDSIPV